MLCCVYVGNLPPDIRRSDLQHLFGKFGYINYIDIKKKTGSTFAFLDFDNARDAVDAVKARDGYVFENHLLRVEFMRSVAPGGGPGDGPGVFRGGAGHFRDGPGSFRGGPGSFRKGPGSFRDGGNRSGRTRADDERGFGGRRGPSQRSQYRVGVTGLPPTASWQDLKDHMRAAGDIYFADTYRDGAGVADYLWRRDMDNAVRNLDGSRFISHKGQISYIRVRKLNEEGDRGGRGGRDGRDGRGGRDGRDGHGARDFRDRSRSRSYSPPTYRHGMPTYSPVPKNYYKRYLNF